MDATTRLKVEKITQREAALKAELAELGCFMSDHENDYLGSLTITIAEAARLVKMLRKLRRLEKKTAP